MPHWSRGPTPDVGGHDNGKPGESRGRKAWRLPRFRSIRTATLVRPPNGLWGRAGHVPSGRSYRRNRAASGGPPGRAASRAGPGACFDAADTGGRAFCGRIAGGGGDGSDRCGIAAGGRAGVCPVAAGRGRCAGAGVDRGQGAGGRRAPPTAGYAKIGRQRPAPPGRALGDRSVLSCRLGRPAFRSQRPRESTIGQRTQCAPT